MDRRPLVIEFAPGTSLVREQDRVSQWPIIRNGPPGTFVQFPQGIRVSLPTDQITEADDRDGAVRVAFGGMRYSGVNAGRLTFVRERELWPEEQLSPERSHIMTLEPAWVAQVLVNGQRAWP